MGKKSGNQSGKKTMGLKKPKKSAKGSRGLNKSAKSQSESHDLLHPAVTENLYYIAHDASDALTKRGFGWPEAPKRKKKGKKRRTKK